MNNLDSFLKKFCINLNNEVRKNKQVLVGRQEEINTIMQVLCKMDKPCPLLIGEPGTGKTAITKYLSYMINTNNVVDRLKNTQIYLFNVNVIAAGAKYQGEVEERVELILKAASENPNIILFIDEIHTINSQKSGEQFGDVIKQYISNHKIKIIGTTTTREYSNLIEKDKALKRRFTNIYIKEPSIDSTISILRGCKESLERHYNVKIYDNALKFTAQVVKKFFSELYEPDLSLSIIEETASRINFETMMTPRDISDLKQHIDNISLEIESKKLDGLDINSLIEKKKEIQNLHDEKKILWNTIKDIVSNIKKLHLQIEEKIQKSEIFTREGNYTEAGKIIYYDIPKLKENIQSLEKDMNSYDIKINTYVDKEEIIETISNKTGIKVESLLYMMDIDKLKEYLNIFIQGQKEPIQKICDTIEISNSGFIQEEKPIASFLFLGSTGVGKTETAKRIGEYLFNDRDSVLIFDMGQYKEEHTISNLLGSPAGYIGYEEEGSLSGPLRSRPYKIIIFDEIEKAHHSIYDVFLAILDKGCINDRKGRNVNFKYSYIIFTSNIECRDKNKNSNISLLRETLEKTFRPELIARIDNIVQFNDLQDEDIIKIIDININNYIINFQNTHQITVKISEDISKYIFNIMKDFKYGTREIKQEIHKSLLLPIIKYIRNNNINSISITIINNELKINTENT